MAGALPTTTARPPLRVAASAAPIVSSEPTHSKTTSAPSGLIRSATASAIDVVAGSNGLEAEGLGACAAGGRRLADENTLEPTPLCDECREQPDRAGAEDDRGLAGLDLGARHRVHADAERLDQHALVARDPVRHHDQVFLADDHVLGEPPGSWPPKNRMSAQS